MTAMDTNVELKTLSYFFHIPADDLRDCGTVFPFSVSPKIP